METRDASQGQATTSQLFQCGQCQRNFSRIDHLSRHVRTRKLPVYLKCRLRTMPIGHRIERQSTDVH